MLNALEVKIEQQEIIKHGSGGMERHALGYSHRKPLWSRISDKGTAPVETLRWEGACRELRALRQWKEGGASSGGCRARSSSSELGLEDLHHSAMGGCRKGTWEAVIYFG